jgi:serine/threonine protein kinase
MGNICSSDADVNILHTPYIGKDVSKYSGPEQYRVMTDAQRSTHSSSPERRRAPVRDGPAVILEHQEVQQEQQEQPWGHSPRPVLLEQQVAEQEQADEVLEDAGPVQFNWTMGKLIGSGAFGSVFSALNTDTGEMVAVKQVSFAKDKALQGRVAEHIKALEAEVEVLKTLQHENIVRYLGTERTEDALHIFLEYVPEGSIASMLAKFGALPESVIRLYTAQLLRGLEYLHQKGIMHRDIKGANILIASNGTVKLADFGASKKIEDLATIGSGSKSIRGTPYWMAPEVIKQTGHGCPADIWSLGCTVIEMATGKPPWSTCAGPVAAMFQIASSKDPPPLPEHLSREAKDFLLLCFNR